jgi:two-component system, sensor histidine kinase RegB
MEARDRVNLPWLIRLRWGAAFGHVTAILLVQYGFGIDLPLEALFSIIALALATNLGLYAASRRREPVPSWLTGGIMVADVLMLTGLLLFAGGRSNPGVIFYFVHVALGTVVLGFAWRLVLVAVALGCLTFLFFVHIPATPIAGFPQAGSTYLWGLLMSMIVAAGFIFYFGDRLTSALAGREAEIADARDAAARDEKLASLATLAAGAAHELSTPLSTIAMLSNELAKNLRTGAISLEEAADDARVIREEVGRCRDVLNLMSAEAGESRGEPFAEVALGELVAEALRDLGDPRIEVSTASDSQDDATVLVPLRPMALALRGIVKNALQASPPDDQVTVATRTSKTTAFVVVEDRGPGMSAEVLRRAKEPFFTTKSAGEGMGLGLFLAHDLARRAGGDLSLTSAPGRGTKVTLELARTDAPPSSRTVGRRISR